MAVSWRGSSTSSAVKLLCGFGLRLLHHSREFVAAHEPRYLHPRLLGGEDDGGELATRREDLAKRLAGSQAEKDRYVRTYAQGHISEEELEVYLANLKNQTDNLWLLLVSVEAELSQRQEQAELADTTAAWLYALRDRLAEVEEDNQEAFQAHRRLVKLVVQSISVGKHPEDGRTEIQITYRFGPPPAAPLTGASESSTVHFKNGSRS